MAVYRNIVITGASRGIGRALAIRFARPEARLCLIARKGPDLAETERACRAAGAHVETRMIDVTDRETLETAIVAFDAKWPVDLVIANAGISAGRAPGQMREADGTAERLNAVNFLGVVNTVEPLLGPMTSRARGQIAIVSSLAALLPQPDLPSYSATKAGVRAYGIALRGMLRAEGVGVSVICPGFVTSEMSARHKGFKPFEMDAARAAAIIQRGLERQRPLITFPWQLAALIWAANRMPSALSDWFVQGFRSEIDPEDPA
ncbi:MAG: SDR family NAD(P)-dependent oxidoreductase [Pseudomonadota bacterium]